MEEKIKDKDVDIEVAEQTLRDDLEVTGGGGKTTDGADVDSPDSLVVYAVAAVAIVAAIAALVMAFTN